LFSKRTAEFDGNGEEHSAGEQHIQKRNGATLEKGKRSVHGCQANNRERKEKWRVAQARNKGGRLGARRSKKKWA